MIITFFGHSNFTENLAVKEEIFNLLKERINGEMVTFYIGGYGNFDNFALKICKEYKSTNNAKILFVTPYLGDWLNKRKEYFETEYDEILYPDIENSPLKYAIIKRNEWMVKRSDLIIAWVNVRFGGAYNALLYAKRKNKEYINLFKDFEV
ncbi:MAG: hypothetical protein E7339_07555 [Clostridiales bacterium]|nr:hypothetical protein [Clostridiales bacterium]